MKKKCDCSGKPHSITCWALFGWSSANEKNKRGIKGHIPKLAATEQQLTDENGPITDCMLISKVRITLLSPK